MMSEKTFTIYRSSAGSGKTYTLAKEYLKLALQYRADYFRHILAVTFTNKATQEMKERILKYLNAFVHGKETTLAAELKNELKLDDQAFLQNCHELRGLILHRYSQFSISTIDSFFQKVIRSFTREAGLAGDFRLETDHDAVLEAVIDMLVADLGKDKEMTQWLVEFSFNSLENDQGWDVRRSLMEFARQVFREEYKLIEPDLVRITSQPDFFKTLLSGLRKEQQVFIHTVREKFREGYALIQSHGLEKSDFWNGTGYTFFEKYKDIKKVSDFDDPGVRVTRDLASVDKWPKKDSERKDEITALALEKLMPLREEILEYREKKLAAALSAELVIENFYAFGLLADISRKLIEYKATNNLMLLADAPVFLNGLIGESETPFIYEKVGSFYRHYLIDEFQDTSGMQWKNFYPLVTNSLDSGYRSLVVGDVKQAIYRWRGGDLKLLQQQIAGHIGSERVQVENLPENFRSLRGIVEFNNLFFEEASRQVAAMTSGTMAADVYLDVKQKTGKSEEGIVDVRFLDNDTRSDAKFEKLALQEMTRQLEYLQEQSVPLRDIAILVRSNREGQKIVAHLLDYKYSGEAKPELAYDVISNESLRLDGSASVSLLLAAMRFLHNPDDNIARAEMAFEYHRLTRTEQPVGSEVFSITNLERLKKMIPAALVKDRAALKKLPLFELAETLIALLGIQDQEGELPYVQAFQELVLNFFTRERNDLEAFLQWWDEHAGTDKTSLKSSGAVDAAQIMTIHKSKGLQFPYVLVPFCSWSLDHGSQGPLLWVKSEEGLYRDAGYLPVRYSSKLSETKFTAYWAEEQLHSYLDNLNLLYVAFTRAERGLYILAPVPSKGQLTGKDEATKVSGLLYQCIKASSELAVHWNEGAKHYARGVISAVEKKAEQSAQDMLHLRNYPVSRWRDKLVIRQAGKRNFDIPADAQQEKISYGIHMHELLARIEFHDALEVALEQAVMEGILTSADKQRAAEELNALFSNSVIASWFDREWEVRTEVPILQPGGKENRIDRLLTKGSQAVVIDYKTGSPTHMDQEQVLAYMNILKQMHFAEVSGYVLYVRTGDVVEVKSGKAKGVKKKDEGQLGLGI
ncbi:MAG: UvrD-helicase domain-containing protein [Cyclobacteriaceae bacterium]|jgi:ATP-dependent exoDNAse (exonuclease V) beta subunit|nr:UvrD-helicase domain-containing protein [Cyclobacteriaceae bacterium]